jgi:hypothetical protein
MSDLAEKVARKCAELSAFHEVTPMCPSIYNQVVERNVKYFLPHIDAALDKARREALEEAAKWCDLKSIDAETITFSAMYDSCAEGIRALAQRKEESNGRSKLDVDDR